MQECTVLRVLDVQDHLRARAQSYAEQLDDLRLHRQADLGHVEYVAPAASAYQGCTTRHKPVCRACPRPPRRSEYRSPPESPRQEHAGKSRGRPPPRSPRPLCGRPPPRRRPRPQSIPGTTALARRLDIPFLFDSGGGNIYFLLFPILFLLDSSGENMLYTSTHGQQELGTSTASSSS